ncbi:pilin protein [Enterobacter mori]|uniref:CfaE/CblD family pilus tip adhesin n=1 Tax=Enterobacter mori TaxID=539813 RepID=UPI001BE0ED09|nr:CfaE/CblD family pilus tip adhesin [Enterobacter mori]MBT1870255.1 pilin protein [Enterobacter mori]
MKFIVGLLFCILLVSTHVSAMTVVGPTPSATLMQEYELPSGAPTDQYFWKQDWAGITGYYASAATYDCAFTDIKQTCTHQSSGSTIKTVLREKRSGMTHTITIQAYIEPIYYDTADPSQSSFCGAHRPLNNQANFVCPPEPWTNSRTLTALITQDEMNKLPIGGVWEGQLKFKFHTIYGGDVINYQANITLKGKATGKQDIYFPEYNGANPLVQLDLHPTGSVTGNSFVEDVTTLDMCLYDGYNSNSDSMKLSFKDEGKAGTGRKEGYFSIYNTASTGTETGERIDYRLEMFDPHSKGWIPVENDHSFTLSAGVNGQDQVRPVHLPSISYPVLCAPAPLRLIVDKFRVTDKTAGYYKGILTVEFSPSLNSI